MAMVTLHGDFGDQESSLSLFPLFPHLFAWSNGTGFHYLSFLNVVLNQLFHWSHSLGGFLPQVRKPVAGLTTLQQCGNFFGIIVLQFMVCLLGSSIVRLMTVSFKRTMPHALPPRTAAARAPVPAAGHDWPVPLQETLNPQRLVWLSLLWRSMLLSLGPHAHKVLFVRSEHLWWLWGLTLKVIASLLLSSCGFSFALGHGVTFFLMGSNILPQLVAILVFSQENVLPFSHVLLFCHLLCSSSRVMICLSIY